MKLSKTIFAVTLVLLLGLAVVAQDKSQSNHSSAATVTSAEPHLVIDSLTHDFGEVKAGTPLRYAFKVKNQGSANLLINSVSPG